MSIILPTRLSVIISKQIDGFSRSTTIEERLKKNAIVILNVEPIVRVGKIDSIFHENEYEEENRSADNSPHLILVKTHCMKIGIFIVIVQSSHVRET
jgi:hypothetical protein